MDAFKVFASMSLQDLVSGPLGQIRKSMAALDAALPKISGNMGKFALAMAPVAVTSVGLVMALGATAREAMAFESVMADVAKVVAFDTKAELQDMSNTILELSERIPMAADGLAAIVAAAAQSGIAKGDLAQFAEQAAKMGVAFNISGDESGKMMADWRAGMNLTLPQVYALADATNYLSNKMNATAPALGQVLQRVGPLGMVAGLAEHQVAALGAAFLSAGTGPERASTALKKFMSALVMGEAMADRQAEAFRAIGFEASQMARDMQTDAQGTIMRVMEALAAKPKELQVSLLTQMFGEMGSAAIAPLLQNMGNLTQAFDLVSDATNYAGSVEAEFATRSATTENALQLLRNKMTALTITMGNAFLPAIKTGAEVLGDIVSGVRVLMDNPLAQWLLQVTAALAGGVIAVTLFAAGIWVVGAAGPIIARSLAPLAAILMGISWPVYAVIAVIALFYAAYKANFGGFAEFIDGVWRRVSLVFAGVRAVVSGMTDGVGILRGDLAKDIEVAGLLRVVTNISRLFYRVQRLFKGFWGVLSGSFEGIAATFGKTFDRLGAIFGRLGDALAPILALLAPGDVTSAATSWEIFGAVVGGLVVGALEIIATALLLVVNAVSVMVDWVRLVIAILTGDWAAAGEIFGDILGTMGESILALADLFGFGDILRETWAGVMDYLGGIDLYECGVAILTTLAEGIIGAGASVIGAVTDVFSQVRNFLPFSDAKEGPLSSLTASGAAIMATLGAGVIGGQHHMISAVNDAFEGVAGVLDGAADLSGPGIIMPAAIAMPEISTPDVPAGFARGQQAQAARRPAEIRTINIHIEHLELPDVQDGGGFVTALQGMIEEYDGA